MSDTDHEFAEDESRGAPDGMRIADLIAQAQTGPLVWSAQRHHLAAALAKAQGEITLADKDRTNEHLHSSYSTLGAIREVGRIPLSKNGIAVVSGPEIGGSGNTKTVTVRTELVHASGQWVRCELTFAVEYMKGLNMMQVIGVAISYARRYTLQAITGVAVREDEDDDDGEALSTPDGRPDARKRDDRPAAPKIEMPRTYVECVAAIKRLATNADVNEFHRMSSFMTFERTDEQREELRQLFFAKRDEVKAASEGTAPAAQTGSKPAAMADEIAERERAKAAKAAAASATKGAKAAPVTISCRECSAEIRVNGLVIDPAAVGDMCGRCCAQAEGRR